MHMMIGETEIVIEKESGNRVKVTIKTDPNNRIQILDTEQTDGRFEASGRQAMEEQRRRYL